MVIVDADYYMVKYISLNHFELWEWGEFDGPPMFIGDYSTKEAAIEAGENLT